MVAHDKSLFSEFGGSAVGKLHERVCGYAPSVKPTALDKRRARYAALVAKLHVLQHTSIVTAPATKARPGVGAFASI